MIKFLSNPEDPELPSIAMIVGVAVVQFMDSVWLYLTSYSQFFSPPFLSLKLFIATSILGIVMGFVLIVRWEADISLGERLLEIGAFASPWLVLAVVIVLSALQIPLF